MLYLRKKYNLKPANIAIFEGFPVLVNAYLVFTTDRRMSIYCTDILFYNNI